MVLNNTRDLNSDNNHVGYTLKNGGSNYLITENQ
jgi:hypothetical protein